MDTGEPAMDDPNTVGDVAGGKKKKKRNPSFRQHLRKMGLPVVSGTGHTEKRTLKSNLTVE